MCAQLTCTTDTLDWLDVVVLVVWKLDDVVHTRAVSVVFEDDTLTFLSFFLLLDIELLLEECDDDPDDFLLVFLLLWLLLFSSPGETVLLSGFVISSQSKGSVLMLATFSPFSISSNRSSLWSVSGSIVLMDARPKSKSISDIQLSICRTKRCLILESISWAVFKVAVGPNCNSGVSRNRETCNRKYYFLRMEFTILYNVYLVCIE